VKPHRASSISGHMAKRNAPFEVFESVSNDDAAMWQKINKTKENAPVPQEVNESLEAMYGSKD